MVFEVIVEMVIFYFSFFLSSPGFNWNENYSAVNNSNIIIAYCSDNINHKEIYSNRFINKEAHHLALKITSTSLEIKQILSFATFEI